MIYGCILLPANPRTDGAASSNSRTMRALPAEDLKWPPLPRQMFRIQCGRTQARGMFKLYSWPFALSINDDGENWDAWISRFEFLLTQVIWSEANVHLRIGSSRRADCTWKNVAWMRGRPAQAEEWQFEGGPREYGSTRTRVAEWVRAAERVPAKSRSTEENETLAECYRRLGSWEKLAHLLAAIRAPD